MVFFKSTSKPRGISGKILLIMMNKSHRKLSEWGFSKIDIKENDIVLDIGCGGGANLRKWLRICQRGRVYGLDYSDTSVKKSKKYNEVELRTGRCKVIEGDVLDIPFESDMFTKVSAFETVYFWDDLCRAFSEIYRVLKKGGEFIICNGAHKIDRKNEKWTKIVEGLEIYSEQELESFLKNAGFTSISIEKENEKGWILITAEK